MPRCARPVSSRRRVRRTAGRTTATWVVRLAIAAVVAAPLFVALSPASGAKAPTPAIPVSGASGTVTVHDGLSASGTTVQPFQAQLTIAGISFPNHEGANHAQPGNVFVHIALRVTNLASATRLIPFNGDNFKTMAMGMSHNVPGVGVNDDVCMPPALDGLGVDPNISNQVATQWCVLSTDYETAVVRPHKSKVVTFGAQVVSQTDAVPSNFALIYCPADAATPTILPVGPGATPTTVPG